MNLADAILILASACQTFVERSEASSQRDRLADLTALEERLTTLADRTDHLDTSARHHDRTLSTLRTHLDAELRHLADRLATLEATGHASTSPHIAAAPPTIDPRPPMPTADPAALATDLITTTRTALTDAIATLRDAGLASESARAWLTAGTWSKPRQPTDAHRAARRHLNTVTTEFGRRGTDQLRRIIELLTVDTLWNNLWQPPANVTPIRRVADT